MPGYSRSVRDRADRVGARVHDLARRRARGAATTPGAVLHLAVRQRRTVLDRPARACRGSPPGPSTVIGRGRVDDDGARDSARATSAAPPRRLGGVGGVHLVDHDHVRAPEVGLAGVVAALVAGAVRIRHHDLEVGHDRRASRCCRRPRRSRRPPSRPRPGSPRSRRPRRHAAAAMCGSYSSRSSIVQWCRSRSSMRREALHALAHQVAVGHRVAHRHDPPALSRRTPHTSPRGLALPRARAHGAHATTGTLRLELRGLRARSAGSRRPRRAPSEALCITYSWETSL